MASLNIPARFDEITPEWLTDALCSTSTVTAMRVRAFDIEVLRAGQEFLSQLARLKLYYDTDADVKEATVPQSLVVKLHAADNQIRELIGRLGVYEREVRFYEEVAGQSNIRTPRRYYSAMRSEAHEYVLLLEDMVSARAGDKADCSYEDAELALHHLARFHAGWWESPRLASLDWIPSYGILSQRRQGLYQLLWKPFADRFGDKLPDAILAVGDNLTGDLGNSARFQKRLAEFPQTVIHGDFRLANLFFDIECDTPLAVVDWQLVTRGRGIYDVAYFLSWNLPVEERRAWETTLLRHYYLTLLAEGVHGYQFGECVRDYSLAVLYVFRAAVVGAMTFTRSSQSTDVILQRICAAVLDHYADDLASSDV